MDENNILPPGARNSGNITRGDFHLMAMGYTWSQLSAGAIHWTPPATAAAPVPAPAPAPVPPASAPALAREPIPGSCACAPLDLSVGDGWVHAPWEWYDEGEDEED